MLLLVLQSGFVGWPAIPPFYSFLHQGTKKTHPDYIVTEVRQYTRSSMQTEYATSGVSDKHRMISVFEIGVFCDRTVLADTLLFAKNYVISILPSRILSFGFRFYNNTSFRKCQPCLAKKSEYTGVPDFSSFSLIYGRFFGFLHEF